MLNHYLYLFRYVLGLQDFTPRSQFPDGVVQSGCPLQAGEICSNISSSDYLHSLKQHAVVAHFQSLKSLSWRRTCACCTSATAAQYIFLATNQVTLLLEHGNYLLHSISLLDDMYLAFARFTFVKANACKFFQDDAAALYFFPYQKCSDAYTHQASTESLLAIGQRAKPASFMVKAICALKASKGVDP